MLQNKLQPMLKKAFIPVLLMATLLSGCSWLQKERAPVELRIGFYNVENLFDTIDQPDTRDEEFTPNSKKEYHSLRYWQKIKHIGTVLNAMPGGSPDVIGLAEVENRAVLEDLVNKQLRKEYSIAHFESPDTRGIDVALLYKTALMEIEQARAIPVSFAFDDDLKTRDILLVKASIQKETVHFFVNHWPSRRGGKIQSMPKRMVAGTTLRKVLDSLQKTQKTSPIIIMGDFNDEPSDSSLMYALGADTTFPGNANQPLYNPFAKLQHQGKGSYNFRGEQNLLDQIILSKGFMQNDSEFAIQEMGIFSEEWMMYKRSDGTLAPSRTYSGNRYYGGYSDHLPVYLNLRF